jgi:N-acetylmuramoyl-L-alanine amidase
MRARVGVITSRTVPVVVLCLLVAAACSAGPPPVARQVRAIRHWTAPDHTRIVLDMSSESSYRVRVLTAPHRIVIDIPSGRFSPAVERFDVKDGVIDRVRVNRLRSGAQVVLDVPRTTPFRHFALKPYKTRPHRIVLDLEKTLTRDQRDRQRERAERIARSGDRIVIIDPGHGGSDPGACARGGIKEKNLVLELSKLIAREIESHDGFKAVLTRKGDYNVGLPRRIQIARNHGGHCFVSVHANAHRSSRPRGFEVYFLSVGGATDKNAEAVAERENLLLEMGNEGRDMTDDVQSILFDLTRNDCMRKSSILADDIAARMRRSSAYPFRGIKQANFVVLRSIAMPSVLVECLFLSNKKDIRLLKKRSVLEDMASRVADGVVSFLREHPPSDDAIAARTGLTHIVNDGETLWSIARKYGVSIGRLRALNGLGSSSKILTGQKLYIRL